MKWEENCYVVHSFAVEPSVISPALGIVLLGCMLSTWLSGVKAIYR